MPEISNGVPFRLLQASTRKFTLDYSGEDITPDNYSLVITFSDGTVSNSVSATDNGDDTFLVTLSVADTSTLPLQKELPYTCYATHDSNGEAYVVERGTVKVEPNLAYDPNQDIRSHVKKVLDELESVIEGRVAQTDASYSIGTGTLQRSISKLSHEELIQAHQHYKRLYAMERSKERLRKGKRPANKVYGRF